ncbi:hypothetical protein BGY98DRAFT_1099299 [Russula aff. rugulosa BPL654]|nr:hypothetical protein BGY98DRAFT_1099299 [Russula aff. rugulosa BPL654]
MSQPPSAPPPAGPSNLARLRYLQARRGVLELRATLQASANPASAGQWIAALMDHLEDLPALGRAAQIDATQDLEVITFIEAAREVLMPFATVDWLQTWPAFVDDLAATVRNLAPGVILRDAMADVVPAMSVAPALPAVRVSPAESSPAPVVPPPVSGPSPTGTPGPSHTPSSGRGLSPQSGPGSDVDRASRPVRALPARASPHRLTPSPDAAPAAPSAPVSSSTVVPAGPPVAVPSALSLPSALRPSRRLSLLLPVLSPVVT